MFTLVQVQVQVRACQYAAGERSGFHQWEARLRRSDSWNVRMILRFGITSYISLNLYFSLFHDEIL